MKKENYVHDSVYFCSHRISDYGLEHAAIDYATLAKSFDAVLNNEIIKIPEYIDYWELENGSNYNYYDADGNETDEENAEDIEPVGVFQWFIITENGAEILESYTDEIVYYNEKLDVYLWGVTHWGTSWDYVLTEIKVNPEAIKTYREKVEKEHKEYQEFKAFKEAQKNN